MIPGTEPVFIGFISTQEIKTVYAAADSILQAVGYDNDARAQVGVVQVISSVVEISCAIVMKAEEICDRPFIKGQRANLQPSLSGKFLCQ